MAEFNIAYEKTSNVEGGYANNPHDTGGETYKGIARKIHAEWKGWPVIDEIKSRVGTSAEAINNAAKKDTALQSLVLYFYKYQFWDPLSLDQVNDQQMANELYDTGVNMGIGRAALFFQKVLNVSTRTQLALDGKIGLKTVSLFNSLSDPDKLMVWKLFNCLQGEKYISICEANPSQEIFLRSWASRVFEG